MYLALFGWSFASFHEIDYRAEIIEAKTDDFFVEKEDEHIWKEHIDFSHKSDGTHTYEN